MKMFLRSAVADEAATTYKLIKLDLQKKHNFLQYDSVKLPKASEILLASSKTNPMQKLEFKEFCSIMLKTLF